MKIKERTVWWSDDDNKSIHPFDEVEDFFALPWDVKVTILTYCSYHTKKILILHLAFDSSATGRLDFGLLIYQRGDRHIMGGQISTEKEENQ